jgi:hemoglobin-like flavoprotein
MRDGSRSRIVASMDDNSTLLPDRPGPSAEQVALVRSTFAQVVPIADVAAQLVYQRIFELAPAARSLFGADMEAQRRHLMTALGVVVGRLDDVPALTDYLARLGARHVAYGVQFEHFDVVGQAVLWALGQGLGDAFTPDVEAAWTAVYAVIADGMAAGMRPLLVAAPA